MRNLRFYEFFRLRWEKKYVKIIIFHTTPIKSSSFIPPPYAYGSLISSVQYDTQQTSRISNSASHVLHKSHKSSKIHFPSFSYILIHLHESHAFPWISIEGNHTILTNYSPRALARARRRRAPRGYIGPS